MRPAETGPASPGASGGGPAVLDIRLPDADWLSSEERAALTPADIVDRIRALQPLIAAHAAQCERDRRVTDEVWSALRRTGVFYHFVPKRWGGLEHTLEQFVDAMLPIGEVCGSTCWTAVFSVDHNWLASHFPEPAQEEFFGGGRYIVAPGTTAPLGRAEPVDGGHRISGRWRFGSGVMNADWVFLGALVGEGEGAVMNWYALPSSEVTVLDTWYVDGMAGSGSNDILVEDAFVPNHRILDWNGVQQRCSAGSKGLANGLYRLPPVQFLSLMTTIPSVAIARGLVKLFLDRMKGRTRWGSEGALIEKSAVQVRASRAWHYAHSAELGLRDTARWLDELARTEAEVDTGERLRILAQNAHTSMLAHKAATLVARGAGASVHSLKDPMQRLLRDINVSSVHQLHEFDMVGEQHGRALFGLEPTTPMV